MLKTLKGLILLSRLELPFAAGLCVILGQIFALGALPSLQTGLFGFLAVFGLSAAILVMNDCIDLKSDKLNAPHRPIPSGMVSVMQAWVYATFLMLASLFFATSMGSIPLIIAIVLAIIGYLYNRHFKKSGLPGNLMVSASVGATFIFGAASVGHPFHKTALFFGIVVALIDLGEEISADAMDMEGDKLIGSRSLAIVYGVKKALRIALVIFWTVIVLSFVPFILRWFHPIFLVPILIMDFSIGISSIKLQKADNSLGRKYIKRLYLGSTWGMLVFLAMLLFNF